MIPPEPLIQVARQREDQHLRRALQISTHIYGALSPAAAGRVLHVFPGAAYVSNGADDVVCLASEKTGPGPLSIVLGGAAGSFKGVMEAGEPVAFEDGSIQTRRLTINMAAAVPWPARPAWESLRGASGPLRAALLEMQQVLLASAPEDSLANLLLPFRPEALPTVASRLVEEVRTSSRAFLAALATDLRGDGDSEGAAHTALRQAAGGLAGLGGGFTPAGDDFLVGTMFALWSTRLPAQAKALSADVVSAACRRTTTVSAAYLMAAADGAAGPRWHRLVEALVAGDQAAMSSSVSRLCRIGHTSGADALTGYVLSMGVSLDGA